MKPTAALFAVLFVLALCRPVAADVTARTPAQLQAALNGKGVQPGTTVWLKGGRYEGSFTSRVQGTPSQPVTVRSAPGEWAVLDRASLENQPGLTIKGAYVTVRDLEGASFNMCPTLAKHNPLNGRFIDTELSCQFRVRQSIFVECANVPYGFIC